MWFYSWPHAIPYTSNTHDLLNMCKKVDDPDEMCWCGWAAPGARNITDVINDVISRPILPNGFLGDCHSVLFARKFDILSSVLHEPFILPGRQHV